MASRCAETRPRSGPGAQPFQAPPRFAAGR